jgi:hypothetical protein
LAQARGAHALHRVDQCIRHPRFHEFPIIVRPFTITIAPCHDHLSATGIGGSAEAWCEPSRPAGALPACALCTQETWAEAAPVVLAGDCSTVTALIAEGIVVDVPEFGA